MANSSWQFKWGGSRRKERDRAGGKAWRQARGCHVGLRSVTSVLSGGQQLQLPSPQDLKEQRVVDWLGVGIEPQLHC